MLWLVAWSYKGCFHVAMSKVWLVIPVLWVLWWKKQWLCFPKHPQTWKNYHELKWTNESSWISLNFLHCTKYLHVFTLTYYGSSSRAVPRWWTYQQCRGHALGALFGLDSWGWCFSFCPSVTRKMEFTSALFLERWATPARRLLQSIWTRKSTQRPMPLIKAQLHPQKMGLWRGSTRLVQHVFKDFKSKRPSWHKCCEIS